MFFAFFFFLSSSFSSPTYRLALLLSSSSWSGGRQRGLSADARCARPASLCGRPHQAAGSRLCLSAGDTFRLRVCSHCPWPHLWILCFCKQRSKGGIFILCVCFSSLVFFFCLIGNHRQIPVGACNERVADEQPAFGNAGAWAGACGACCHGPADADGADAG